MLLTLAIIALSTAGGLALTYLYEKNDSLLARIAAGNVIGAAILAVLGFLFASAVGLSVPIILLAVAIAATPALLLRRKDIHKEFRHDLDKAKGKTQGATPAKAIRFAYYVGVMLILGFFFERAMIETDQGIFTGGSQKGHPKVAFSLGASSGLADQDQIVRTGNWPSTDFRRVAFVEPSALPLPRRSTGGTAKMVKYDNTEVTVEVSAPRGGVLVLNDVWHPWWFAEVDGMPAKILRANGVIRAVILPQDAKKVVFRFEPARGLVRRYLLKRGLIAN